MTTIQNLTSATRSAVCLAMAALIVTAGLVTGAVGADVAFQSAIARSTATASMQAVAAPASRASVG
jgi:hypothetical protein